MIYGWEGRCQRSETWEQSNRSLMQWEDAVGNYREIASMDTGCKIYAKILRKRLENEITEKEVLDGTQMGFREGKGTAEAIYILKEAIENGISKERGKVAVGFADMKAAIDKLKRESIWDIMKIRRRGKADKQNKRAVRGIESRIQIEDEIIDEFEVEKGVRQGCPFSPTIFNIAVADLEEKMTKVQRGGIRIRKKGQGKLHMQMA